MRSGTKIAPLQRADIPELSRFLTRDPAASHLFSHEVLEWKYFDGPVGTSGDGVRSLIARAEGRIIAHVGMCHRRFVVSGDGATPVSTMHAIDWQGSAAHPGVGALLMLEAFTSSETQYAVRGTPQAQSLFPRLGFERKPDVALFRKVLAPLHRLRTTDSATHLKWARAAMDTVAAWRARTPPAPRTVELRPVERFTAEIAGLQRAAHPPVVTCHSDHSSLNYLLRCPLGGFSGWTVHTPHGTIGFAVLKITPQGGIRLGRIIDFWLNTDDPAHWQAAVTALVEQLRARSADDVTCYATTPHLRAALVRNGFTQSGERSVYVRDKQRLLPQNLTFALSGFEADGALL